MSFKDGDVVQLKSGGVPMTISHQDEMGDFVCVWHERKGSETKPMKMSYPGPTLQLYVRPPAAAYVGRARRTY